MCLIIVHHPCVWRVSYILCHIIIHTMSHHHTYYVTSSYILCHIILVFGEYHKSAQRCEICICTYISSPFNQENACAQQTQPFAELHGCHACSACLICPYMSLYVLMCPCIRRSPSPSYMDAMHAPRVLDVSRYDDVT